MSDLGTEEEAPRPAAPAGQHMATPKFIPTMTDHRPAARSIMAFALALLACFNGGALGSVALSSTTASTVEALVAQKYGVAAILALWALFLAVPGRSSNQAWVYGFSRAGVWLALLSLLNTVASIPVMYADL